MPLCAARATLRVAQNSSRPTGLVGGVSAFTNWAEVSETVMTRRGLATVVATVLVDGPWEAGAMRVRLAEALGKRWRWAPALVKRVLQAYPKAPRGRSLRDFLMRDDGFHLTVTREGAAIAATTSALPPGGGYRNSAFADLALPEAENVGDLAKWLGLELDDLEWLANRGGWRTGQSHYHCRWQRKRNGSRRLVEAPKEMLKLVQQRINQDLLGRVPVHAAAHGFRRDGSVGSYVVPHVGRSVVCRIDLADWFLSVGSGRVHGVMRSLGYPEPVADRLTALCVHSLDATAMARLDDGSWGVGMRRRGLMRSPHLPTGAPTSPALANLAAWRLDVRLAGLAASWGLRYSRYADDLAFSGKLPRQPENFLAVIYAIVIGEGFEANYRKTRVMRAAQRQRLAGVVINERPNLERGEYDRLKAILTNCVRHGAASQNRDGHPDFRAHLAGRIGWCRSLNPNRAERLAELFSRIDWDEEQGR